mmetsp:Transcript_38582/g.100242  ORF Transcript_38582/g.100242 Transcript_38582/m.100242 type:complete len:318 (+) Transcript_38582:14-967(+)
MVGIELKAIEILIFLGLGPPGQAGAGDDSARRRATRSRRGRRWRAPLPARVPVAAGRLAHEARHALLARRGQRALRAAAVRPPAVAQHVGDEARGRARVGGLLVVLALLQLVPHVRCPLVPLAVVEALVHAVHQLVVAELVLAAHAVYPRAAPGSGVVVIADVQRKAAVVEAHRTAGVPHADGVLKVKADAGVAGAREAGVVHARREEGVARDHHRAHVDLVHKHEGDLPLRRKVIDALVLDGAARVRGGAKLGAADLVGAAVYQVPVVQTPTVRAQEAELRELAEQILRLGVPGNAAVRGGRRIVILRKNQEPGGR